MPVAEERPAASGEAPAPGVAPGAPRRRPVRRRRRSALDEVRDVSFPIAFRGYDRAAVDAHLARIAQLVTELQATQSRDSIIQRALEEVGEQTSGVLQRANEAAAEVLARARAQAEGRIQRAEREADDARAEADQYVSQLRSDAAMVWQDRVRLIEDMRQLAEELLSVADNAFERLPAPEAEAAEDDSAAVESAPPTAQAPPALEAEPDTAVIQAAQEGPERQAAQEGPEREGPPQDGPTVEQPASARSEAHRLDDSPG